MKFTCTTILLIIHVQFISAFFLREYGFKAILPEIKMITDYYERALQSAGNNLEPNSFEPETNMTTVELIMHLGYPAEVHHVTTEDGYILEIHRIPNNEIEVGNENKLPVFLQHGLLSSSSDWVINLRNQSLGYMLADAGYDVWLGNIRGNTYCQKHVTLSPDQRKFWEFSWDEMGEFDVPAMIDYILNTTGHKQVYYVGHSMGTTMAFSMLATKLEYNDKIKTMFALGPVITLDHIKVEILKFSSKYIREILLLFRTLGIKEFLPNNDIIKYLVKGICQPPATSLCLDIVFQAFGKDLAQLNVTRLPIYLTHSPACASPQTIAHYGQIIQAHQWQHYDWGYFVNILKYGSLTPPKYDVTKITTPVALFYGLNDPLADPEDEKFLAKGLRNLIGNFQIGDKDWNHVDFVWAIDAGKLLNMKIIKMLQQRAG